MRRRPVDVQKKLPLIRSQKELDLGDDSKVEMQVRATPAPAMASRTAYFPSLPL